ncbi:MAG: hypothetical protein V4707_08810 [Pseudomonadota bacterium]
MSRVDVRQFDQRPITVRTRPALNLSALADGFAFWTFLVALLTVSITEPSLRLPVVDANFSDILLIASAATSFLFSRITRPVPTLVWVAALGSIIYSLGLIITSFFYIDQANLLITTIKYFIATGLGCLLACRLLRTNERVQTAIFFLIFGCAANGALATFEMLRGTSVLVRDILYWGRYLGLTEHPNELGGVCAVFGVFSFHLAMARKGKAGRIYWILLLPLVSGLVASSSMGAAGSFCVGVALSLVLSRKPLIAAALVASAVFLFSFAGSLLSLATGAQGGNALTLRLAALFQSGSDYTTARSRLSEYSLTWDAVQSNPLIGHALPAEALAHNFLLFAWGHGGILALVGTAVFCSALMAGCWTLYRKIPARESVLPGACFVAMVAFLCVISVSPPAVRRSTWVPTWVAAATIGLWASRRKPVNRMPWEDASYGRFGAA